MLKVARNWAMATLVVLSVEALHAAEDVGKPRVAIDPQQRAAMLQAAYACNRPDKSPQQQRECDALYEQLRQQIAQRTQHAHMQARPHVQALIEQLPQR
jgi:hypothetical protein